MVHDICIHFSLYNSESISLPKVSLSHQNSGKPCFIRTSGSKLCWQNVARSVTDPMEPTHHRVNAHVFTLICYPCVYEPQVKLFSLISRETQKNSCLSPSLETNREPKHVCQCVWKTHSEAVNRWLLLAEMLLMGLSWPLSSPSVPRVSVCHSLSTPPLHPLSKAGDPGTTPSAQTQSRWAFGTCWAQRCIAVWLIVRMSWMVDVFVTYWKIMIIMMQSLQ